MFFQPKSILEKRMTYLDTVALTPVMKSFLAGSFSGICSTLLFQPLDLVKTRLQSSVIIEGTRSDLGGMVAVVGRVVKNDHVFALWKGMTPSMMRCVPGVGLYFSSLQWLNSSLCNGYPSAVQAVLLGASARAFSGIILIPFTVVKTRYESDIYRYKSVIDAVRKIYMKEGVKGLTCGLIPTIMRDAPFSGIYLMFYTQTKNHVPRGLLDNATGPAAHFICGVIAGSLASLVTQPFDVLKTQMQIHPDKFDSVFRAAVCIFKQHGPTGYLRGLAPRMIRRTLMAAMAWTVYEQMMKSLSLQ